MANIDYIDVTWSEFKKNIEDHVKANKNYIYRGQSNANWKLKTSLHRTGQCPNPEDIHLTRLITIHLNMIMFAYIALINKNGQKLSSKYLTIARKIHMSHL